MQQAELTQYVILNDTQDGLTGPGFVTVIVWYVERRHLRGLVIVQNVIELTTSERPTVFLRNSCYWYRGVMLDEHLHHMQVVHA